jgi:hypothetical protein
MSLAWPVVALVAIGVAYVLLNRWMERSVAVEAAYRALGDVARVSEAIASEALKKAEAADPEKLQVLDARVSVLETAMGMRAP